MPSKFLPFLILFYTCSFFTSAYSQDSLSVPKRIYDTKKVENTSISLDGKIDDLAWNDVEWSGDFTEFQPTEGKKPNQQTKFKILYSEKFLFMAFRCYDSSPDSLVKRMSRRDYFPGDWVEVNLDTYHDLRSAFSFNISVSGVRGDEFVSNNGNNWDTSWNPIWQAKSQIDDEGWTAEIKIPLSQLRFGKNTDKVWGLQVTRLIFREQARSIWQVIPRSSGVWVSGFGEIHGLQDIQPQKQIEIAPYTVLKSERTQEEPGNPFASGVNNSINFGVDGKVAVTSDLILDYTINPDFGQVEADPSQVRIDGFQNFYRERRPFFVESKNIYDFEITGSGVGGDYDSDLLFYSRRIGSRPSGYPSLKDGEFAKLPQFTKILGATKFSGKTKSGLSIGLLESITSNEYAQIDDDGQRRKELIEPLSNFFVSRLQKDYKGGQTILGGIFTAVNRQNNLNSTLHNSAYSGGLDLIHYWKNRTYYFKASAIFSNVNGDKAKILETQTSISHLFQRPNAPEVEVDSNRTSLTGTGGTLRMGKSGGKQGIHGEVLNFDVGLTYRSPQLEMNDIGFMQTANEINQFTWLGIAWQKPFSIFRSMRLNFNNSLKWDFGGQFLFHLVNTNFHANFKNNWFLGAGYNWNSFDVSNTALRGGSSLRKPPGSGFWAYFNSDERKKLQFFGEGNLFQGKDKVVKDFGISAGILLQPFNSMSLSAEMNYSNYFRNLDQYVSQINYSESVRDIVSGVSQKTLNYTFRLNYNLTPDITLQYYGQPFITKPIYSKFSYVSDPLNKSYDNRFIKFLPSQISLVDNQYFVDENLDGTSDYSFNNPSFNFTQFRSNLVFRWEYKPGSEFYLVWSQNNTPDVPLNENAKINKELFDNLLNQKGTNIFLLKLTYRFLK